MNNTIDVKNMDSLLEDICTELYNQPDELTRIFGEYPYEGPVITRVLFLCSMMARVNEMGQDYLKKQLWNADAKQIAERIKQDEINLGTLLYVNQKTRDRRVRILNKVYGHNVKKTKPFSKEMQQVNSALLKDYPCSVLHEMISYYIYNLFHTFEDIYKAQHPDVYTVDKLKYIEISTFEEKQTGCEGTYMFEIFKGINAVQDVKQFVGASVFMLHDITSFLASLLDAAFTIDKAVMYATKFSCSIKNSVDFQPDDDNRHQFLAWQFRDTREDIEVFFSQIQDKLSEMSAGITEKEKTAPCKLIDNIIIPHQKIYAPVFSNMVIMLDNILATNAHKIEGLMAKEKNHDK